MRGEVISGNRGAPTPVGLFSARQGAQTSRMEPKVTLEAGPPPADTRALVPTRNFGQDASKSEGAERRLCDVAKASRAGHELLQHHASAPTRRGIMHE